MTPPVRIRAVHAVVGDLALTTPADFDRIDHTVGYGCADGIGYLLTGRRVGRLVVRPVVVGDLDLLPPLALIV